MEVRVNVPDEIVERARKRGLSPEVYVEQIVAERVNGSPGGQLRSATEVQSWLESLAQFSDKIPPLPDTISREWIYQDHE